MTLPVCLRAGVAVLVAALRLAAAADNTFLIRGATIHPVSGPEIPNGDVLVRDGKIVGIGSKLSAQKGIRIIEGKGLHLYPGMIDSATQVGLSEINAVRETSDITELGNFNPQLRAAIAVNPASEHIPVTRVNGITSVITMPQGTLISGQAALIRLDGWTWEEMAVRRSAAMNMRFPTIIPRPSRTVSRAAPPTPYPELKRNYEQRLRELQEFFESARRYQQAKKANGPGFKPDVKLEAMLPVLEGKTPLMIEAARERPIREAIQFAGKQHIKMVLAEGTESWKLAPELKSQNIPVILGPTLALPLDEDDPYDRPFTTPGELYKAGVKIAFGSFNTEFVRNLPYQAAAAVAFGLPYEEALKAVTLNPAQIWGVADQIGSIEEGKWADLILTDGDPLEAKTQIKQLFIKGRSVDLDSKHYRLYQKYLNRP